MSERKNTGRPDIPSVWQFLVLIPFSFLYSLFIVLGDWEKAEARSGLQNFGSILLWMALSYVLLLLFCFILSHRGKIADSIPFLRRLPVQSKREGKWYVFLIFFLLCFLSYLPYFLMYYPTWLSNDAVWQLEQAVGWAPPSNHHPWFHTLLIKFFFMAGYRLFGTYTEAMAFYTFAQMVIMALVFAFLLYQLYKSGTRLLWLILATVFYAFLPLNGLMSICMAKDEFFTAALLVFAWLTVKMAGREDAGIGCCAAYFTAGLLVCLLRSNGIFVFLGTAVFLAVPFRRRKAICLAAVLLCYLFYHGPVLKAMDVEPADTIEALTMPTQHILCAYVKGGELTQEEAAMIDRVLPVEQVSSYYNPYLFDIVKAFIRENGNQEEIARQKWEYFKLWLHVGLRNPLRYLEAEVKQTAGYWALDVADYQYVVGEYYMVDNPFGVTTQRKVFSYDSELAMYKFLMKFQDIYNRVWSLGLNTWVLFFCFAYAAFSRKNVMIFVPFVMLLATLLLAVPVYNVLRYVYGLFMALPLLFSYSFGREGVADEKVV
ncbi:MAG: DUF6020 family protein [Roseburia sp.]|nr:DUF6020 family protein [Roseburia sp.]MCM1242274.1 DUF6020 family protein [Roseburia sp.]